MEGKMILFLLLSTVTFTMSQELGDPVIILNSTTDYFAQTRSIHVLWLLNSTSPGDILLNNQTRRVQSCEASIDCENGYTNQTENCQNDTFCNGWNFNNIPLNEKSCNVTVRYNDTVEGILYSSIEMCSFPDDIGITVDVHGAMENLTVGDPYEIQCKVYTDQIVNSDIVDITWIGPDNDTIVADGRLSVITNSTGHNHTSTLQFSYLSEDDEGLFICHVTILSNFDSGSIEIKGMSIPATLSSSDNTSSNSTSSDSTPSDNTSSDNTSSNNTSSNSTSSDSTPSENTSSDNTSSNNTSSNSTSSDSTTSDNSSSDSTSSNSTSSDSTPSENTSSDNTSSNSTSSNSTSSDSATSDNSSSDSTSSDSTSSGAAVIAVISVAIAMSVFMALGICIGARTYWNKRNKVIQWTRDEEIKYVPPTEDSGYSAIGRDAASECESVSSDNHKVTEWIKNAQMPAIDEESDSISIDLMEINEQKMLEHVFGFNTVKRTRIDKFSVSTADSGIDTELDNNVNKYLQPQTGLYVSHRAAEDMHSDTTDPGETEQPNPQEGSNSLSSSQQTTCNLSTSSSSQSDSNSALLSKFYNALLKQNSNGNDLAVASANAYCSPPLKEGSDDSHTVASNSKFTDQSSSYLSITTAVGEGTDQLPPFHSVTNSDSENSTSYAILSSSENVNQPLVHPTCIGTTTSAKDGGYVDHYVANQQPSSHPTYSNTTTPAKNGKYVDQYAASNFDQSMSHLKSATHEKHIECNATTNFILPTSQPTYNDTVSTGCYVDYYSGSNATQSQLPCYKIATAKDGNYVDCHAANQQPSSHHTHPSTITTAKDGSHVDDYAASNTDQPLSHPTHNTVVLTGSYIDRYTLSNANHPSSYSTYTKPVVNVDRVGNYNTPNVDHPKPQPIYKDTVSTGCYIGCYTASDIDQLVPHTSAATPESHADHNNATSNVNHPTMLSSPMQINTVSTGSYIDHYSASVAAQPLSCYKIAATKDGNDVEQYPTSNHLTSFPTYTDTLSTGTYIDHYTASNGNYKFFHSLNGATLPTTVVTSCAVHSNASSAKANTLPKPPVCIDTSAEGIYIEHSTVLNNDRPQSDASAIVIKGACIDHCITSNADQPLPDSVDDDTSPVGVYVDCYMASNNDSKLTNAEPADSKGNSIKSSTEKRASSFTVDHDSCPSPITGVYLPCATAMEENTVTNATPNSTVNKTSTQKLAKKIPEDLLLPSGSAFSYTLLNESTPMPPYSSQSANDCNTPNVGEYIAYNLENLQLGMTNHYKPKIEGNHPPSLPVAPYSTRSHSTANGGYFDYSTAIHQGSTSTVSSVQPHMQQNTNTPTSMPNAALMQNVNGYMTESDV